MYGAGHAAAMHDKVSTMCRDLAQQVHDVISDMRKHLNAPSIRNALIVGGTDPRASKAQLQGGVHIITGTPGTPALCCLSKKGGLCSGLGILHYSAASHALPGAPPTARPLVTHQT